MFRLFLMLIWISIGSTVSAQTFTNVAQSSGINDGFGSIAFLGGGISFCDFDNDGDDDLTFTTPNGEAIYFYRNTGGAFQKIPPLVSNTSFVKQALWVDYDNDGDKDFFLAVYNGDNKLYKNNSGSFTDVTFLSGLPTGMNDLSWGASFGDFDNDGWLDLYVINYITGSGIPNYLYRNNGDGTFSDVTGTSNTSNGNNPDIAVNFFDFNLDGYQDIFSAVDRNQFSNALFKNNGDGTFTDVRVSSGVGISIDAMNTGVGDYDNDGDLDLYISNVPGSGGVDNVLFRNNYPIETFTDVTTASGTGFGRIGWGANFFDFDNDMDLDLYVSSMHEDATQPNALFVNDGTGVFSEPLPNGFLGDTLASFCNTVGDFNGDGFLDIAVSHRDTFNFHLWRNDNSTNANNFLKIKLEGVTCNKDAIGTMVEMYVGGNKYIRSKHCGEAYLGQVSDKLHFGLGTHTKADSVIIKWLGGNVDKYYDVPANQTAFYLENLSSPLPIELVSFKGEKIREKTIQLNWVTQAEVNFEGFELQRSYSGLRYEPLTFISGKGGNATNYYEYEDKDIQRVGRHYYRLKMIDNDGSFKYSKVEVINIESSEIFQINQAFPNPTKDYLNLNYYLRTNHEVNFKIVSADGKVIQAWKEELLEHENNYQIEIKNLLKGNYFLISEGNFSSQVISFSVID